MSRLIGLFLPAAAFALSATAASAQLSPLTNGPNGTQPNVIDSARGFDGINAIAPEREFLYHPERAGNAAAALGIAPVSGPGAVEDQAVPAPRHARRHRRHEVRR